METGTIATNRKGFGFINFDGQDRRIVFEPGNLLAALSGDTVEYKILKKNAEGEFGAVTRVVLRGKENYVGIVLEDKGVFFLCRTTSVRIWISSSRLRAPKSSTSKQTKKSIRSSCPGQIRSKIRRLKY